MKGGNEQAYSNELHVMAIKPKSTDALVLRRFIPIASLPEQQFEDICSRVSVEEGKKGTVLFRQGDKRKQFVYLLSGTIELRAGDVEMETIEAESSSGRFALAHQIPRKVSAIANGNVRFVRVDTALLTVPEQNSDEQSSYEVSDIPEEDSDDWMTTLLQSPVFQRLPAANLQKVMMELEEVSLQAGEILFNQGDPGDFYYIIKEGLCALTRKPTKNAKEFKLAELKSCDAFGEDALISDGKRNLTATMTSDGVMLRLHKFKFLNLVKGPVIQYVNYDTAKENLGNRCALVDVRSPEEFRNVRIKGSTSIPFFSIRMHLNGLSRNEQQIIVCQDGNTSEAAAFLLIRFGFDAVVLRDGLSQVPGSDLEGSGDLDSKACSTSIRSQTIAKATPAKGSSEKQDVGKVSSNIKGVSEETDTPIQLKEQFREMEVRCETLQQKVDLLETHKESLIHAQAELEKDIIDIQARYSSGSEDSTGNKEAMDALVSELADVALERDGIRADLEAQGREFKEIKDTEQRLKEELIDAGQENGALETKLNTVSEAMLSVQNELKSTKESGERLQDELSQRKDECNELNKQLEKLEKDAREKAEDLKQELSRLDGSKSGVDKALQESLSKIAELKDDLGALTAEKEQWAAEKGALIQEKNEMQRVLEKQGKVAAQFEKAQQLADTSEQEKMLQEAEFSQRVHEFEGRENQLQTELDSVLSENGVLEDKLKEKENQTSAQEVELSALREQAAILEQKINDNRVAQSAQSKSLNQGDALNDQVVDLQHANDKVKKEKHPAEQQVEILSAQVDELKSVIQAFLDQDDSQDHIEETHSLKSELEMVRVQAETDVKTMQTKLEKLREEGGRLAIELEKEKQQTTKLKVLMQKPTPVNPALTPSDDDVFAMLEEASSPSNAEDDDNAAPKKKKLFSWG